MANRKCKQTTASAPKARRRKPGWLRRSVGQLFASVVAPILVGIAVQSFQAYVVPAAVKATPAKAAPVTRAAESSVAVTLGAPRY